MTDHPVAHDDGQVIELELWVRCPLCRSESVNVRNRPGEPVFLDCNDCEAYNLKR